MTGPPARDRLHAMDALRAYALLGGVVLHATMSFMPGARGWVVADASQSPAMAWLFFVIHVFRMPTFFLIAGFFARMLLEKRGVRGFVTNRLTRIAVPMAVSWPLLFAGVFLAFGWADAVVNGGIAPDRPSRLWLHPAAQEPGAFYLLHLWFLYFLLIFYGFALLLIAAAGLAPWVETVLRRTGDLAAAAMRSAFAPLVLAVPLAGALYYEPVWLVWFGIPAPDKNLIPDQPALAGYGTAFAVGWLLHARPELLRLLESRWRTNTALAAALVVATGLIAGPESIHTNAPWGWLNVALCGLYASAAFATTFAVVGAAHRFLNSASAWRRYLADASYWIYLVHLPLVMALQVAVCTLPWPAWVKLLTILGVAIPAMLLSYQLMVRTTVIGAVLNGRRRSNSPSPGSAALRPAAGEAKS